MDTGLVRQLSLGLPDTTHRVSDIHNQTVRTDLAAEKTVQASAHGGAVSAEPQRPQAVAPPLEGRPIKRGYATDANTGVIVFRSVDTLSGQVLLQIPTEDVLRVRQTYAEKTADAATAAEHGIDKSI